MWNKLGRQGALEHRYLFYYHQLVSVDVCDAFLFIIILVAHAAESTTILRTNGDAVHGNALPLLSYV